MKISILTLFPEMFIGPFAHSIVKRAQENGYITIDIVNIRDFGIGKHKIVDDTPYGGGIGMVLRVDVLEQAITTIKARNASYTTQKVVLMDPDGPTFVQAKAKEFATIDHLILVCGHYEGVDERVKSYIDEEVSIGDFITTGGELPAMLITDAVTRLVKGVLKEGVTDDESFSFPDAQSGLLEHPHYTRPEVYKEQQVPSVLLSGDHKRIASWKHAAKKTKQSAKA